MLQYLQKLQYLQYYITYNTTVLTIQQLLTILHYLQYYGTTLLTILQYLQYYITYNTTYYLIRSQIVGLRSYPISPEVLITKPEVKGLFKNCSIDCSIVQKKKLQEICIKSTDLF